MTSNQISNFYQGQVSALTPTQIFSFGKAQIQSLNIDYLTNIQISLLTPNQIYNLPLNQITTNLCSLLNLIQVISLNPAAYTQYNQMNITKSPLYLNQLTNLKNILDNHYYES